MFYYSDFSLGALLRHSSWTSSKWFLTLASLKSVLELFSFIPDFVYLDFYYESYEYEGVWVTAVLFELLLNEPTVYIGNWLSDMLGCWSFEAFWTLSNVPYITRGFWRTVSWRGPGEIELVYRSYVFNVFLALVYPEGFGLKVAVTLKVDD